MTMPMNRKMRIYWLIVGPLLAALLIYAIATTDLSLLRRITPGSILVLILLTLASSLLDLLKSWILLWGLGYRVSPLWLYLANASALWMNYTAPARLGMPAKVYLYRTLFDVPVGRGTAAVVVEAFLLVFVSAAVALAGILTLFDRSSMRAPASALAGLILLGFVLLVVFSGRLERLGGSSRLAPLLQRLAGWAVDFLQAIRTLSPLAVLAAFVLSLSRLLVIAVTFWVILAFLGETLAFWDVLAIKAISRVTGFVSMIPMGLGVHEVTLVGLLSAQGTGGDVAVLAAVLDRLATTGVLFVLGATAAGVVGSRLVGTDAGGAQAPDGAE